MSGIGRPKKHGRQTTLIDAFRLNQHNTNNEENVDFELENNIEEEGPPEKKGKGVAPKRSFKHGWKLIHKWAYPIIGPNGEEASNVLGVLNSKEIHRMQGKAVVQYN